MNKMRLKTVFVLTIALLCICTMLAAIIGIYHANQMSAFISTPQANSNINTLVWQLVTLVVISIVIFVVALTIFQNRFFSPLYRLRQYIDAIAGGDLSQRIQPSLRDNELNQLYVSVRRMQENLIRTMSLMRNLTDEVSAETNEMVGRNNGLSTRVESQATALQQTAASMEELASTVRQNADNAQQANRLAVTASEVAQRGGVAVGEVVSTMQAISDSSTKISDIVGVIDSIAFQTNILALNAAVEAARAGEQGRGFAVVASEVRALAQRSAQAAREITDLIEDSVEKVNEGSDQVERAGSTMQEIVDSVRRVTDIMGEISAATSEQSTGIEQVNKAVNQMDHSTSQNAQMLERASTAVHFLSNYAQKLQDNIGVYKLPEAEIIDLAVRRSQARSGQQEKEQNQEQLPVEQQNESLVKKQAKKTREKEKAGEKKQTTRKRAEQHDLKTGHLSKTQATQTKNEKAQAHKLLRPDLSGQSSLSKEDDWEEF